MNKEISEQRLEDLSEGLGEKIQALIDSEPALEGYQIDGLELSPKEDGTKGISMGCSLKCKVVGFPPRVKCKLVCET